MATITWKDSGSYHTATISGTGTATLSDLYDYLYNINGDETYMSKTGSAGAYVYTFNLISGEYTQRITVQSGATFELEDGDTLNFTWSNTSSSLYQIYVVSVNSLLKIGKGCTIDGNSNGGKYGRGYFYVYANLECNGTEAEPITIKHYRDYRFYMYYNNDTYKKIYYTTFSDFSYTYGAFNIYGPSSTNATYTDKQTFIMDNVTIDGVTNTGRLYFYDGNMKNLSITNCTFTRLREQFAYRSNIKFDNCTFIDTYSSFQPYECGIETTYTNYETSKGKYFFEDNRQEMLVVNNPTFDDPNNGNYGIYSFSASTVLVKDGTFKNHKYPLYAHTGNILLYGTQTYENTTKNRLWGRGTFLYVRKLDLTVKDPDGNPLKNATVSIQQKEGKEILQLRTNENGKIESTDGEYVFLVEKEETSLNHFTQWSDGSSDDKKHSIKITHPDYGVMNKELAMTEDKELTVQMPNTDGTTIYNSTIYSGTIR